MQEVESHCPFCDTATDEFICQSCGARLKRKDSPNMVNTERLGELHSYLGKKWHPNHDLQKQNWMDMKDLLEVVQEAAICAYTKQVLKIDDTSFAKVRAKLMTRGFLKQ